MNTNSLRPLLLVTAASFLIAFPAGAASVSGSKTTNVNIPDGSPGAWVSSQIVISSAPADATVTGIDVSFACVHPYSGDLVVDLNADSTGSLGTRNLWNREGGAADNPSRTVAGISTFNGLSVNRTWYLYARDYQAGDGGYIDEWTITVYYTAVTPTTYAITPNPKTVSENVGSFTFTITRSGGTPAETIYASTTTTEGHSNAGDYTGISDLSVTYASGQASKTVTVTINDDSTEESSETFGFIVQRNTSDSVSTYLANSTFTITDNDATPTPTISSVSPSQPVATGSAQPFTVSGANFIATTTVDLEDVTTSEQFYNRPVSARSGTTAITINPNFGTATANHSWRVRVNNGSTPSTWYNFTVVPDVPTPTISSVNPAQPVATGSAQPFTVSGANFIATATVDLEDVTTSEQFYNRPVSARSGTTAITINPNFGTATANHSWRVRVNNGATTSTWFNFTVVPDTATPTISSVSPAQPVATGSAQPFTVSGANFISTATVDLEDVTTSEQFYNRPVSARSGTTAITINPNFGTATANHSWRVRVNNGSTPSTWYNFTVVPDVPTPTISSVNPAQPVATGSAQPFTVSGANFIATATVDLEDVTTSEQFYNRPVSARSGTTAITINPNFGTATANHSWRVRVNNGATSSTWFNFTVVPDTATPTISSVSPAQPVATGAAQPFTVSGANFISTATVDLEDVTTSEQFYNRPVSSRSGTTSITINPNFGTATANHSWRVRVNNGSTPSTWYNFTVTPTSSGNPAVSDGFDYPIGDRGVSGGVAYALPEFPSGIRQSPGGGTENENLLYSGSAVANPYRENDGSHTSWWISQDVGAFNTGYGIHAAEDWNRGQGNADRGEMVYASADGTIVEIRGGTSDNFWTVVVRHNLVGSVNAFTIYGHVCSTSISGAANTTGQLGTRQSFGLADGQQIRRGDPIARIGDLPSGPHLHFEIRVNTMDYSPKPYFYAGGTTQASGQQSMTAAEVTASYTHMRNAGFVDPSEFIDANRPGASVSTTYTISPTTPTVAENVGSIAFTITRSGGTPPETIYARTTTTEGNSNSGDYSDILNKAVTFTAGLLSQTVTVPINNDTTVESSENFGFIVQRIATDPVATFLSKTTFTITDDDVVSTDKSDVFVHGTPGVSPNPVTAGNEITVSYTIRNQGLGAAGSSQTKIRVKDSAGSQLTSAAFTEAALAPGVSAARTRNVLIPATAAPGTYTAFVYLDNLTELDQSDTGNDRAQTAAFTVRAATQPPQLPNLVFSSALTATLETNGNNTLLTASATMRNSGAAESGPFTVRIRVLSNTGTELFTLSTAQNTLAQNATRAASFNRIPLSTALSPGTYTAELTLDSTDAVAEQNEADNVATTTFQVVAPNAATVGEPSWTKWDPALFFTPGRSMPIDSIVIHTAEGSYQGTIDWFKNASNPYLTSSHYVVSPEGEITQMVLLEDTAHHATYYNARSIGIEVAGYASSASTWTPQVNASLRKLVAYLATRNAIPLTHPEGDASTYAKLQYDQPGIVAHSQIQPLDNPTYPYSQKYDPGVYFDWVGFIDATRTEYGLGSLAFAASSAGPQQQSAGSRFSSAASTGTSTFPLSLMLNVPSERVVRVEHSSDLVSWVIESTVVLPEGSTDLNIDFGAATKGFYRVSWGYQK